MQEFNSPNITNLYDAMKSGVRRIGIIQENIKNNRTVAFKGINPDSVLFTDTLSEVFRDESQGVLEKTGNKLDLALSSGEAFFLVEGKDGPLRTRDGEFHISPEGKIVDFQNRELVILDQDPDKSIGVAVSQGADLEIDKQGTLRLNGDVFGRIAIDMNNPKPGERAYVLQGKLETSNVDVSHNIVQMMQTRRYIDTVQGVLAMEMVVDKSLIETYGRNV